MDILFEKLSEQADFISDNPFEVLMIAVIFVAAGWVFARVMMADLIASLKGQIELKDQKIAQQQEPDTLQIIHQMSEKIDRLEKRLAPLFERSLDSAQVDLIKKKISVYVGTVNLERDMMGSDFDRIYNQIERIFIDSGWELGVVAQTLANDNNSQKAGITIRLPEPEHMSQAAKGVIESFHDANILFTIEQYKDKNIDRKGDLTINFSTKYL